MTPPTEPRISRFHLQTILTNTNIIKNIQAKYSLDPNRFNKDRIPEACDFLLSVTPPLHTKIFMYYADREIPKSTFSVDEISEAIINDSTIEDSIKKEIMYVSAIQMGMGLEELYPKRPSILERLLVALGRKMKEEIYKKIFQECFALLQESLLH